MRASRLVQISLFALGLVSSGPAFSAACEGETGAVQAAQEKLVRMRADIEAKRQTMNKVAFPYYLSAMKESQIPAAERAITDAQNRLNACIAASSRSSTPVASRPVLSSEPVSLAANMPIPEACYPQNNKLEEYRLGAAAIETRLAGTRTPTLVSQYQFDLQIRRQMVLNAASALNNCIAIHSSSSTPTSSVAAQPSHSPRAPASIRESSSSVAPQVGR